MGNRVLVCLAALLLAACAKRDSGCATPATQASLAPFVNSHVRQNLRLGGYDPLDSGLVKISRIEGFEATRLDEERERSSCRAIIQFDVEGLAMPTPVEYDLLPSSGDDDSAYDTVVSMKLPLGGIGARLNNGILADLRKKKEGAVHSLEGQVIQIRMFVAANESGKFGPSPFAEQGKVDLAARQVELEQARKEVAHITESLRAGRGGR